MLQHAILHAVVAIAADSQTQLHLIPLRVNLYEALCTFITVYKCGKVAGGLFDLAASVLEDGHKGACYA